MKSKLKRSLIYKIMALVATLIAIIFTMSFKARVLKASAADDLVFKGTIKQVDLYEKMPIKLEYVSGHPFAAISVTIYRGRFNMKTLDGISKYVDELDLSVRSAETEDEEVSIKIVVDYHITEDVRLEYQTTYKAPSYAKQNVYGNGTLSYNSQNPVEIDFTMSRDGNTETLIYEKIDIGSQTTLLQRNDRFVDLSFLNVKSTRNIDVENAAIGFKYKIKNTDALYQDGYTWFDISFKKEDEKTWYYDNEYKYYVDKRNGGIYEEYSETCDDELVGLFIPFDKDIPIMLEYLIKIYDIGNNHEDFVMKGTMFISNETSDSDDNFGQVFQYKYVIKESLKGVKYE